MVFTSNFQHGGNISTNCSLKRSQKSSFSSSILRSNSTVMRCKMAKIKMEHSSKMAHHITLLCFIGVEEPRMEFFTCFRIFILAETSLIWLYFRSNCFPPKSNASQCQRLCFHMLRSHLCNFHLHSRDNVSNSVLFKVKLFSTTIERLSMSVHVL